MKNPGSIGEKCFTGIDLRSAYQLVFIINKKYTNQTEKANGLFLTKNFQISFLKHLFHVIMVSFAFFPINQIAK